MHNLLHVCRQAVNKLSSYCLFQVVPNLLKTCNKLDENVRLFVMVSLTSLIQDCHKFDNTCNNSCNNVVMTVGLLQFSGHNSAVTSLIVPSSSLQVVNNLFQHT